MSDGRILKVTLMQWQPWLWRIAAALTMQLLISEPALACFTLYESIGTHMIRGPIGLATGIFYVVLGGFTLTRHPLGALGALVGGAVILYSHMIW